MPRNRFQGGMGLEAIRLSPWPRWARIKALKPYGEPHHRHLQFLGPGVDLR